MRMSVYGPGAFAPPGFNQAGPSAFSGSSGSAFSPPSASSFSRPGFASHPREHLIQRAIQPGFERPMGTGPGMGFDPIGVLPEVTAPSASSTPAGSPSKDLSRSPFSSHSPRSNYSSSSSISPRGSGTLITRAEPDPGELTIEKTEPWAPSPGPSWASRPAPSRPVSDPVPPVSRPSPPSRRMRLRDIMSSAVRGALGNQELDDEAERFNNEIGSTFMSALGTVKKEK